MNRDSNAYTFLFATIMVLVVASALAFTASSLKDLQAANVRKEKMQNILATVGINIGRDQAEELYKKYITAELSLTRDGTVDEKTDAFEIKLSNELKKPVSEQRFPIYEANLDEEKFYIIPLRGAGLWNAIWGYIALEEDKNTIKGAVFDHKGETAGLGAEITQKWFQDRFLGEKVFDVDGNLVGINVSQMRKKNITNIKFVLGKTKSTNLPKSTFDLFLLVDVYHELEYPYEIMKDIKSSLKDDGVVVLLEYRKEDPSVPIKPLHKMSVKQVVKEMKYIGLTLIDNIQKLPRQHMLIFGKS